MVPFSVALFVWKAVVAFLYNNTWQFGHFLDLSIPAAKMVLLTLDTLKYNSIVKRRIFIRPENGGSRKQRLLALLRSWGFKSLLQCSNFLWNSIYFGVTLSTQVIEIGGQ